MASHWGDLNIPFNWISHLSYLGLLPSEGREHNAPSTPRMQCAESAHSPLLPQTMVLHECFPGNRNFLEPEGQLKLLKAITKGLNCVH